MDTDYAGTLSSLDPTNRTARERRGKYKANKRKPRNSAPSSQCVSYNVTDLDSNNKPTRGTIFSPARKTRIPRVREAAPVKQPEVLRYASIVGYTGDVD